MTAAALLGGHARVGFENNLFLPDGARADSNAELVGTVSRALQTVGLATQSADGLREEIAAAMARCMRRPAAGGRKPLSLRHSAYDLRHNGRRIAEALPVSHRLPNGCNRSVVGPIYIQAQTLYYFELANWTG